MPIADLQLLTCDEEVALGRRVRGGDVVARDELVRWHQPFAVYLAAWYGRRCQCREDDLFQAALLGLIRGADTWNPDGCPGKRFITYARYYVRLEILAYLYDRPLIRIPHSARATELAKHPLGMRKPGWQDYREWTAGCVANAARVVQGQDAELNYPDSSQYPDSDDSHVGNLEQLRLGLEMLPPWHAEVIRRLFGLDDRPRESINSIALEAGICRQTVSAIQKLALKRLRKIMGPRHD
ncbi:MAG: sigma-70 family RNA polymerase sigma factor [Isosphaeraceae bacterium]